MGTHIRRSPLVDGASSTEWADPEQIPSSCVSRVSEWEGKLEVVKALLMVR